MPSLLLLIALLLTLGELGNALLVGPLLPRSSRALALNQARSSSSELRESTEATATSTLEKAMAHLRDKAFEDFRENEAPEWMKTVDSLPFECTECGKCCQTQGDVYMSPEEVKDASKVLGISINDFIARFGSYKMMLKTSPDEVWVRLRDTTFSDGSEACVFLDEETKHCRIYEARPTQCRTYPFWPMILRHPSLWDAEVVDSTDPPSTDSENTRVWTAEDGGCEGMRKLSSCNTRSGDRETTPIQEAYEKLFAYTEDSKMFENRID